jgi:hypothetical protein
MSKVTASTDFDRAPKEQLTRFLTLLASDVVQQINGGLDFQSNFNCKLLTVTFSAANAAVAVVHGLGRVPTGFIVYQRSANLVVYDGVSPNTSSTLNLRASAAGTVSGICF